MHPYLHPFFIRTTQRTFINGDPFIIQRLRGRPRPGGCEGVGDERGRHGALRPHPHRPLREPHRRRWTQGLHERLYLPRRTLLRPAYPLRRLGAPGEAAGAFFSFYFYLSIYLSFFLSFFLSLVQLYIVTSSVTFVA